MDGLLLHNHHRLEAEGISQVVPCIHQGLDRNLFASARDLHWQMVYIVDDPLVDNAPPQFGDEQDATGRNQHTQGIGWVSG